MPQLSIETFFSQYFWLVVFLFSFYYYIVVYFIPNISNILKTRSKLSESSISEQSTSLTDKPITWKNFNLVLDSSSNSNVFNGKIKAWTKSQKSLKAPKKDKTEIKNNINTSSVKKQSKKKK